jgi:ATP-dependent helicase/nuclease subunit A
MKTKPEPTIRELKPEQKVAAHTLDRHLSVTAGPGAGKTFVLVQRYLEILRAKKVSVDNIVAITFTNRAANEMRERVRGEIDKLLQLTGGNERQRWLRHKRALEGAVITTIHGFCSRLLHEFPVEADIDPQFTLLDEHRATMLLEAMVEESLTNAIHHGDEKIVQLTTGATRAALAAALVQMYWKYRGSGFSLQTIEKLSAANHATEADYFDGLNELDAAVSLFLSAQKLTRDAEKKRLSALVEWPDLRAILAQPANDRAIAAYCQAIENFRELRPRKGSAPVEGLDDLLWGSTTGERFVGKVPALRFDLLAKHYSLALIDLLRDVEHRLNQEKRRLSALDFDDLQLRTLKLLNARPEVRTRIAERYRFFLVDEFQDTNGLQRDLMKKLALDSGANLFIVGDRKQSIYGFRGADVDVFAEMTSAIVAAGGKPQPLKVNFRSQKSLIDAFNFLFKRIFAARSEIPRDESARLGYVEHESSIAERPNQHEPPLVEFLVSILPSKKTNDNSQDAPAEQGDRRDWREGDAAQVVERIISLTESKVSPAANGKNTGPDVRAAKYGDIAILFRALTNVWVYESALRRAGIPYLTVQGKGFYQREEITDLIQLLRFLDNTTDELALAAILRSPLCGISDNSLLALRCGPKVGTANEAGRLQRRNLLRAIHEPDQIQFIDEDERAEIDRAAAFLDVMIERRNRYGIAELLRHAVAATDYLTVIAANFDGAQRIANVEKLFLLAERFEASGANLIRDFVRYVEEFEAIGGRESEGQMDKSANVVHLMTIHQAKGQEFPVVIIPELHRKPMDNDGSFVLDPHRGLSVKIPDGRGQMVRGALLHELQRRAGWREEFESMRLLYVAATRAKDRLILSGAAAQSSLKNLSQTESGQWLAWLWQALELDEHPQSGVLTFDDDVKIQLTVDREWSRSKAPAHEIDDDKSAATDSKGRATAAVTIDSSRPLSELFPLLAPLPTEPGTGLRRFSVTQLINFQRCARQYLFDRLLHAPGREELAVWNNAEAPEPPANLTAALKGAVIHRFCETFVTGDDPVARLRASFDNVIRQREAELAGRAFDINHDEAMNDLLPLAQNYLNSDVFERVQAAEKFRDHTVSDSHLSTSGLRSELRFRLRRPLGILTGTIDKLLIVPARKGNGFDVEIIDFKTNRFRSWAKENNKQSESMAVAATITSSAIAGARPKKGTPAAQGAFNFESAHDTSALSGPIAAAKTGESAADVAEQIKTVANAYQLQMQSYALALRELIGAGNSSANPSNKINSLRATLHFIEPNVEIDVAAALLGLETCARAIDEAMLAIVSLEGLMKAEMFPPNAATHCRICNFRELCQPGQDWLRQHSHSPV